MNPWILLAISICLEIVATNLLKVSDGFTKLLPTVGSCLLYTSDAADDWRYMPFRFILSPSFSEHFPWAWFTPFGRALVLF